jgi:hypothetical protein
MVVLSLRKPLRPQRCVAHSKGVIRLHDPGISIDRQ